jgi:hypothetical protein
VSEWNRKYYEKRLATLGRKIALDGSDDGSYHEKIADMGAASPEQQAISASLVEWTRQSLTPRESALVLTFAEHLDLGVAAQEIGIDTVTAAAMLARIRERATAAFGEFQS